MTDGILACLPRITFQGVILLKLVRQTLVSKYINSAALGYADKPTAIKKSSILVVSHHSLG